MTNTSANSIKSKDLIKSITKSMSSQKFKDTKEAKEPKEPREAKEHKEKER